MSQTRPGYFRGTELPRLVLLAGLLVGGWSALLFGWRPWAAAAPAVQAFDDLDPGPIEPDAQEALAAVRDRSPMTLLDNAPLKLLLEQARERSPRELAAEARVDVLMTHLAERPDRYRGVPIRITGTALRSLTYEVAPTIAPEGRLFEAWIVVQGDAQKFPYACVFEDRPEGFPLSATMSERVVFNGYFLKLLRYVAGDKVRYAPLLVGKLGWTAPPEARREAPGPGTTFTVVGLGTLILYAIVRWTFQARTLFGMTRSIGPGPMTSPEPEPPADMESWLASLPDDEPDEDDPPGPSA